MSDQHILEAAARVMARTGPNEFTLAVLGREIGLAPATLLQRFGSKRELMLACFSGAAEGTEDQFGAALDGSDSPLRALVDLLCGYASCIAKPEELANHLAFLQMDLADPDFHRLTLAHTRAVLDGIERMVVAAQRARELRAVEPKRLALTVSVVYQGALLLWCVLRQGAVGDFVRKELETVLEPYVRGAKRKASR